MHPDILKYTNFSAEEIVKRIQSGVIQDVVSGALALAWARVRERAQVSMVSAGILPEETRALGFSPYQSPDAALAAAFDHHGPGAKVTVLTPAPEMLPILTR